ncbi:hypothetical protein OIU77_000903 [Salix suchowensis]|uniref:ABC-type xenobiotic transporter n=1 Tax=Salix suchowensis TaxID=1278906 RepID=A0ABQ9B9F9_9ROSI|nr:hypothetical protein OIU77_000903 [Salix suchowensis]
MEDLWMVFCGESGNLDMGEKLSSSGSGLVFQPTSCINHALIICFNALLLIMLLLTSIQKSSSPSKIDDILPRFRGYSRIQIVSAIFNGCIGFVYLCSGIWILEEQVRKNQTALPLKSWYINIEGSYGSDLYAPLNDEANGTTKTDSAVKVTLFAEAGFFNKMSFWWLNPLMRKGKEKTLEDEDIPKLREEDRAESCYIEFLEQLNKHKQAGSSQLSLLWIIIFCHWKDILISGFFALLKILTLSAGPLLLNAFILVAEGKAGFKYEGYVLALTLFFSKNLESLSQRQWYFRSRLIGLKVKSLLTAAIYKKQLRLSSLGRLMHSGGEIMNYVTVDAYRIGEFPFWFHQTWTTSLQLCISLVILYRAMGLATFAALMVIIITVLCNAPLAKLQHKFQSKLMVAQDERLKACNEALVNMKVLKLYAWETHFKNAIENLREVEYKHLSSVQMRRAYNGFLFWSSPVLVSSATFGACYFMKIPLHANNVFTFVATLRLVQDPIRSIPDVIGVVIQAKVAFARIVKFLDAPELQSRNVQQRHNTGIVNHSVLIKSADFSWEENSSRPTLRNQSLEKFLIQREPFRFMGGSPMFHKQLGSRREQYKRNILFGSEMDRQRYQDTLERCSLVKDLELLPYGDLTEIDIYLLDDPFSAVDAQTATSLFNEYITGALSGKTVLLVTHQVDFLPAFDSVMLMSNGEILQAAPYHQLLSSSQEFQDLVNAHKETAGSERLPEANAMQRQGSSAGEIEKSHVEKQHKTSRGDQLIKQEEKEVGDTGFKPYIEYLNQNKGYLYFALASFGHLLFVTGQILQNSWMAASVDDPHVSPLRLIVVYLSIGVTSMLFVLCRSIFTVVLGLQSSKSLFSQLLNSLFHAPMSFYDSTPLGRILSRVASDLSIVDLDVPFSLIFAVGATTNAYSNMGVLAFVTWQVLFVSIPMVYLAIRLQRYYFASAKELMRINGTTKSLVANHLAESVAGALTIRAFEGEDPLCVVLLPPGTFSSGFIGMALSYGLSLNMSLVMSIQNQCMAANYIISVERLNQYMHIPSEAPEVVEDNRPPSNWPAVGKVDICDLQIRYRPDTPLVLRGISCTFEGGHKIGIVGRTGSGKTTLIGALFRLVEPTGGKIIVDGIDISKIGLHDLRSRFGIIPQDPTLFNGTVRYNLDPLSQHTDQEIWEVLRKCQLHQAVQEKEQGLDSLVVEDGSNWSMGQRQLFCLGRALLRRSRILVLDEATASIDNATDLILQKTIRTEFSDCTVITVAHRIPTVMDCTMVLAISDGKLVEFDEPRNLMKTEGSLFGQLIPHWLGSSGKEFQGQAGRKMYSVATMDTVEMRRKIGKGN